MLPSTTAPTRAGATATARAALRDRVVVVVSIDGLNPQALRRLGRRGAPHLHRMIRQGAATLNARTAYELTVTLPNHAGMLTGRRVTGPRGHHVDVNNDPGSTLRARAGRYRASFFDVVHDHGGTTALLASKRKFALFDRTWNGANGAADPSGASDGRDKIDYFAVAEPARLVDGLVQRLAGTPHDATFLHISLPDLAGHEYGFMGARYLQAVRRSDALVGRIMRAVVRNDLRDRVDLVVTADHGGARSHHHGTPGKRANYTVPLIVWGPDARRRTNLYALNPGRTRPRAGRPSYAVPPIRNTDVAALVTTLLGVRPNPGMLLPGTRPLRVG